MEIPEIYNIIIIYNFFNIIKNFNPGWANANEIFILILINLLLIISQPFIMLLIYIRTIYKCLKL